MENRTPFPSIRSEEDLKAIAADILKDRLLVVVSNREPYVHRTSGGKVKCFAPVSGLTTALDPVMRACGGVWIAHGSGDGDRKVVDTNDHLNVPPEHPSYTLRRIWMNKEEESGYYYSIAGEMLWPLCHIAYTKPKFVEQDWQLYRQVNDRFARAVIEEIEGKKAFVFLQDYHFTMAAKQIKTARPDAMVAQFWHIPWPNPEAFRVCPFKEEILEGMLGNDLMGFHIKHHADNFIKTVDQEIESRIDYEESTITRQGQQTMVQAFPISVDFEAISREAETEAIALETEKIKENYGLYHDYIGVGVDRIDYTKGLVEKFLAIDRFLEKYPEYQGRFVYFQTGVLSRIHIKTYRDLNEEINSVVERINWKYSTPNWSPIILTRRQLEGPSVTAVYRLGDFCMVSSLHDGMNLVAKEYIASHPDLNGSLILSQFTGSARELSDGAILVNPFDIERSADAIHQAITLPKEERAKRMARMRDAVATNNIYHWVGTVLSELTKRQ